MFQYILFDLDGTLTDSGAGIVNSFMYALEAYGVSAKPEELGFVVGPPLKDSFARFGFSEGKSMEAIEKYRERYLPIGIYENSVYPGVREMLGALRAAGRTLVVATSKPEPIARKVLEHFDLMQYFDFLAGATMDEKLSKKSDIISMALRTLGVDPACGSAVMVGDRAVDVTGANAAGIPCIGVSYGGYGTREELEDAGAYAIVDSAAELCHLLLEEKRNISLLLPFKALPNTRDLGGMRTQDGRIIKSGLLYRSGCLADATAADIAAMRSLGLTKIFDFRTQSEMDEKPDPDLGVETLLLPIIDDLGAGVVRGKRSDRKAKRSILKNSRKNPVYALEYMKDLYRIIIDSELSRKSYRRFLSEVLQADGAVLWHCTAGKDRAGVASILIETILGLDPESIRADYLYTNDCLRKDTDAVLVRIPQKARYDAPRNAFLDFYSAREAYFDTLYQTAEAKYGSMESFIRSGLGVDDTMIAQYRKKYLD